MECLWCLLPAIAGSKGHLIWKSTPPLYNYNTHIFHLVDRHCFGCLGFGSRMQSTTLRPTESLLARDLLSLHEISLLPTWKTFTESQCFLVPWYVQVKWPKSSLALESRDWGKLWFRSTYDSSGFPATLLFCLTSVGLVAFSAWPAGCHGNQQTTCPSTIKGNKYKILLPCPTTTSRGVGTLCRMIVAQLSKLHELCKLLSVASVLLCDPESLLGHCGMGWVKKLKSGAIATDLWWCTIM